MPYTVIIESAGNNYSAYVPSLLGCVSTGATLEEVKQNIRDAIDFHVEGMLDEGLEVPPPDADAVFHIEEAHSYSA